MKITLLSTHDKGHIPLSYLGLRPGLQPGRRPVASWNLAYHALASQIPLPVHYPDLLAS